MFVRGIDEREVNQDGMAGERSSSANQYLPSVAS